jgi:AHBA synthesis associated protein
MMSSNDATQWPRAVIFGLDGVLLDGFAEETHRPAGDIRVFRGVRGMLRALQSLRVRTAVTTGQSGSQARSLLRKRGLLGLLDAVVGSDDAPRPDIVPHALGVLDVPAPAAVMIGEAVGDLRSAQTAGVAAAVAAWGNGDETTLRAEAPDLVLHSPGQVPVLCGWGHRLLCGLGTQRTFRQARPVPPRGASRSRHLDEPAVTTAQASGNDY